MGTRIAFENARRKKALDAERKAVEQSDKEKAIKGSILDAFDNNLGEGISSTRPDNERKRRKKT